MLVTTISRGDLRLNPLGMAMPNPEVVGVSAFGQVRVGVGTSFGRVARPPSAEGCSHVSTEQPWGPPHMPISRPLGPAR